jgi:hypothetical protein
LPTLSGHNARAYRGEELTRTRPRCFAGSGVSVADLARFRFRTGREVEDKPEFVPWVQEWNSDNAMPSVEQRRKWALSVLRRQAGDA